MSEIISNINAFLESPLFDTILNLLILAIALVPALYVVAKFLFGDVASARRLLMSPRLMGWLFFFCGFELLLHIVKIPILLKLVVIILAIVALPFVLFLEIFVH